MTERKDAKLLRDREARLLEYIGKGYSALDIARREGLQYDYAVTLRNRVAREHGLKVVKPRSALMPYGLDEESRTFRSRLGDKLHLLLDKKKMEQLEVARKIGVPRKLQRKAIDRPNAYDWKLSELQQLAKALDVPFKQFMLDLLRDKD